MHRKTKIGIVIAVIAVLLIGGGIAFYLMYQNLQSKNQAITEMSQQFELEKEQLTDEYSQLALQYEGYGLRIGNDSLANLLDAQRYKVQRLLIVKSKPMKRINELQFISKTFDIFFYQFDRRSI